MSIIASIIRRRGRGGPNARNHGHSLLFACTARDRLGSIFLGGIVTIGVFHRAARHGHSAIGGYCWSECLPPVPIAANVVACGVGIDIGVVGGAEAAPASTACVCHHDDDDILVIQ